MKVEIVPKDARVKVAVIFDGKGGIKPVWFEAQGQKIHIERICYTWRYQEGAATVLNSAGFRRRDSDGSSPKQSL